MPSNQTKNYKLSQWVKTDKVLMDDFNADNAAIDAALAKKAEQSELNTLKQTVTKKAEQTDVSALQTAVSGKGNCRIWATTYTGKGGFGPDSPNSIIFPARPELVFVGDRTGGSVMIAVRNQAVSHLLSSVNAKNFISWNGNTMSWYATTYASGQLNSEGGQYDVVALIAES